MEIAHVNHASLLLENNGHTIFTDPWVNLSLLAVGVSYQKLILD